MVVTNAWPELIPTVARNSVSPKFRSTMFAGSGMTQLIGPVRRSRPTMSATMSGPPPMPSVTVPTRHGDRHQAEQDTQHHPKADGDVAELRRRLHRVAEMGPRRRDLAVWDQHTDPITKLEHQVGRWHKVDVVAPDVQELKAHPRRQWQFAELDPGQTRL